MSKKPAANWQESEEGKNTFSFCGQNVRMFDSSKADLGKKSSGISLINGDGKI
jgi:hypothetical protein